MPNKRKSSGGGSNSNVSSSSSSIKSADAATAVSSSSRQVEYVNSVTDLDVLLGRGGYTNHHPGNTYFRTLVRNARHLYYQSKKFDKLSVAKQVVSTVIQRGGRFLIPSSTLVSAGGNNNNGNNNNNNGDGDGDNNNNSSSTPPPPAPPATNNHNKNSNFPFKSQFQIADEHVAVAKASQALRDAVYEGQKKNAMEAGMEKPFVSMTTTTPSTLPPTTTMPSVAGGTTTAAATTAAATTAAEIPLSAIQSNTTTAVAVAVAATVGGIESTTTTTTTTTTTPESVGKSSDVPDVGEGKVVVVAEQQATDIFADADEGTAGKNAQDGDEQDPKVLEELRSQLYQLEQSRAIIADRNHSIKLTLNESEQAIECLAQENKLLRALYGDRDDYAVANFY